MLGRIHYSEERNFVPALTHVGEGTISVAGKIISHGLFKLGWDAVDKFKLKNFIAWAEQSWKEKFPKPLETNFGTLPKRYDDIIKNLVFAVPHDYMVEIIHLSQLYYSEQHRARKFDTCIRDMCMKPSHEAINCSFKLLADCVYDEKALRWFREDSEVDKRLVGHLLMYKFWCEAVGRGLVRDFSGFSELDRTTKDMKHRYDMETKGNKTTIEIYRRCLNEIRIFEADLEKFYSFVVAKEEQTGSLSREHNS